MPSQEFQSSELEYVIRQPGPKRNRMNQKETCRQIHKHYVEYGADCEYDTVLVVKSIKNLRLSFDE